MLGRGIAGAAAVAGDLADADGAAIPAPRQTQLPRAPVGAEQRVERAELEPAHVQLAGVLRRRHEAADVRAPVGNARQRGVHGHRHVRLQRLPRRVDVARPEERAVARHAGGAVAMQRVRPLVRPVHLAAFPVHADAVETRDGIVGVALIGPPAVDADVEERLVRRPVARHLTLGRPRAGIALGVRQSSRRDRRRRARVADAAAEHAAFDRDVEHDLHVLRVQRVDHLLRIGEVRRVPGELAVVRVPA